MIGFLKKTELSRFERELVELNKPKKQTLEDSFDFKLEVLNWVENIDSPLTFDYFGGQKVEKLFLNILLESEEIKNYEINEALENYILKQARQNYDQAVKRYADHIISPQFLAEGIVRKQFSGVQISRIRFDHSDNEFNFYARYGDKNLVKDLREELLNPKLPKKSEPKKQLILFEEKKRRFDPCCCECCC